MKRPLIGILVLLAACTEIPMPDEPADPVLAEAYGKSLYLSNVENVVPKGISGPDSASIIHNYINKWIQQQVMLHNAKENLSPEEQDFTEQLEVYRNSLLLYTYESKLISMNLDTVVTDSEIENYYRDNKEQFVLKGNILKFDYVKLPRKSKQLKDFRKFLKPGNFEDSVRLVDYCQKYSTDYWLTDEWVLLQDLLENIPLAPDNEENFLRRTRFSEVEDEEFAYLLRINDFKTTDSIPPLSFERENIRNIIINSRKLELLEKLREKDIDAAFSGRQAVIFKRHDIQ